MASMRALLTDTLGKRLFLLLWVTLVVSHLLGFWLVRPSEPGPGHHGDGRMHMAPGWFLPNLPPVMGMPGGAPVGAHDHGRPDGLFDADRAGDQIGPPSMMAPHHGDGGFHEPPRMWLDYLARVLVMGVAAWLGSRWLTAPMRRLGAASRELQAALQQGSDLPVLNERTGPAEVRQTAHVFNDMARGLKDQFEQRSLMMAAVSHDLRTPLTRLRMRLETLLPDPVAERCVQDVQDINALIGSVLDVLNEERNQEPFQPVDVMAMVQAMADDAQELGQAVTASGDAATVRLQPVAFKRVLSNLISNALRYGQQAHVQVAMQTGSSGAVCITIDDHGPGIPADQLAAVFRPFVRLDASRGAGTGSGAGGVGLGLYIARELVHRQGGAISLRNRPEGGLRAEIVLPLH